MKDDPLSTENILKRHKIWYKKYVKEHEDTYDAWIYNRDHKKIVDYRDKLEPVTKKIVLTESILYRGKSLHGGWSLKQVGLFGIKEFKVGWKKGIIGRKFNINTITKFLELKDAHLKEAK